MAAGISRVGSVVSGYTLPTRAARVSSSPAPSRVAIRATSTTRDSSRLIARASSTVAALMRSGRRLSTSAAKIGALAAVWVSSSKNSNAATVAKPGSLRMPPSRCANRFDGLAASHARSSHAARVSSGTGPG